jgi:hypothetical protein
MIRRFNYTERQSIPADCVRIRLVQPGAQEMSFDAELKLADLELPSEAAVFVEAYYKSSYMRFAFGTVGTIAPPRSRRLSDIDRGTVVFFRVKVVDPGDVVGRILAEIDNITASGDETPEGKYCLLPVDYKDLGQQIWRLELGNNRPVLELNNTIPGIRDIVRRDGQFAGLVFPAVVRQILTHILLIEDHDDFDDVTDWKSLWLRFMSRFAPDRPESSTDARGAWIEEAVAGYASHIRGRDRYVETLQEQVS